MHSKPTPSQYADDLLNKLVEEQELAEWWDRSVRRLVTGHARPSRCPASTAATSYSTPPRSSSLRRPPSPSSKRTSKLRRGEDWRRSDHNSAMEADDAPTHYTVADFVDLARRMAEKGTDLAAFGHYMLSACRQRRGRVSLRARAMSTTLTPWTLEMADSAHHTFGGIFGDLGLQTKPSKAQPPAKEQTIQGVLLQFDFQPTQHRIKLPRHHPGKPRRRNLGTPCGATPRRKARLPQPGSLRSSWEGGAAANPQKGSATGRYGHQFETKAGGRPPVVGVAPRPHTAQVHPLRPPSTSLG